MLKDIHKTSIVLRGHTGGWTGHWQNLLKIEPVCINRTDPALHDAAAILGEDFGDEAIEDMADTDAGAISESLEADIEPAILPEEKGADAPVSADEVSEKDAATPSTPDASTSETDAVEMPEATENSAQDALPDSTQGLDDLAEDSTPEDVAEELSFEELEAELNEYSEQLKAE